MKNSRVTTSIRAPHHMLTSARMSKWCTPRQVGHSNICKNFNRMLPSLLHKSSVGQPQVKISEKVSLKYVHKRLYDFYLCIFYFCAQTSLFSFSYFVFIVYFFIYDLFIYVFMQVNGMFIFKDE